MTKDLKHVLIMAGGTGGHVFPGLAVASYLREQGVKVSWLGTAAGLEADLVPEASISLYTIDIHGLRGKGLKTLLLAPFKVLQAIWQARKIVRALQPDVVLGMGGFASGPGGLAAFLSGRPLLIHEQNAKAGLTNRVLYYLCKNVLTGFPDVFPASSKVEYVGNPVRKEIEMLSAPVGSGQAGRQLRLLVLGGSLGAKAINEMLPDALCSLSEAKRPDVWHQSGKLHVDAVRANYDKKGISAKVEPFISDMASAYQWADLVVCRAGALTVTELCVAGVGAVLVPFPYAVDDHQTANAQFMVENHAAICVQQSHLDAKRLAVLIEKFVDNLDDCQKMALAAYGMRKVDVPQQIFAILGRAIS